MKSSGSSFSSFILSYTGNDHSFSYRQKRAYELKTPSGYLIIGVAILLYWNCNKVAQISIPLPYNTQNWNMYFDSSCWLKSKTQTCQWKQVDVKLKYYVWLTVANKHRVWSYWVTFSLTVYIFVEERGRRWSKHKKGIITRILSSRLQTWLLVPLLSEQGYFKGTFKKAK